LTARQVLRWPRSSAADLSADSLLFTDWYEVTAACAVVTLVFSRSCGAASTCMSELIREEVLRPLTRPSTELVTKRLPSYREQDVERG
jgi:hypothetical protein